MKKNRKGHYVLFNIEAPAAAIAELERTMRINEDVLRYLTLRVDQLEEGPSPIMQGRGGREDRPRRSDRDRYGEGRDDRGERPAGDRPAGDRPAGDRPAGDRPAGDRPAGDRAGGERPATEAPGTTAEPTEKVEA
jgi:small subunit ribosomal protein S6